MAEPLPYNYPIDPEIVDKSQESITKQQDTTSVSDKFNKVMSYTTMQQIQDNNVGSIGNNVITPDVLNRARTNNKFKAELYMGFKEAQAPIVQAADKPIVAGSTSDYKGYDNSLFDGMDKTSEAFRGWMEAIDDRQLVARVFGDNSQIPVKGRQIIVNSFKTGNFYTELARMAKSLPGDFARLPNLIQLGQAAVRAGYHSSVENRESGAFGAKFGQIMANSPGLASYNNSLNKNVITRDMAGRLNTWYKEQYIEKHGQEDYDDNHRVANVKMVNGNIVFDTDPETGEVIYREKELDAGVANDLLELSYGKLSGTEKAGMFFATIAPFTAGARLLRSSGDIKLLNMLDELRKEPAYKGLNNLETLQMWRKRSNGLGDLASKTFRKAWQTLTLTSDKTRVLEGENVVSHLSVIHRYDTDIFEIGNKITKNKDLLEANKRALKLYVAPKLGGKGGLKNKKELEKTILDLEKEIKIDADSLALRKQSKKTYVRKNGSGQYDSPYLRSTVADDLIISSAMGYGPQLLNYGYNEVTGGDAQDTRWTEMLIGLTTPLVAPRVVTMLARGGVGFANFVSGDGVTDIARLLEGSKYIPLVNPGILLNNDEAKFRKLVVAFNVGAGRSGKSAEPTTDELKSFSLMSKIYQNMRPEFREKSFQSLIKYNDTMAGFEKEMVKIGLSPEMIEANMKTLNLSMAEVTGLAPLIAYSNKVGAAFTSSDAITSIDKLSAIAFAQEDKLNGIDLLLDTLKQSIKQEGGLDLDSNSGLQTMFNNMNTMVANQRNIMTLQKAKLQEQLDTFSNNIGVKEIDSDTIDTIVNLNAMLGGRVLNAKERAVEINTTYNKLMDSTNKHLDEVKLFAGEMTEKQLRGQVRRVADVMFDLELGRRRALGSKFYRVSEQYASDNNIKVDMTKLITKYIDTVEDFNGKPLQEVFGRGSDFFSSLGPPMQKTFNKMATGALNKRFNREDINNLKSTLEFQEKLPQHATDLELALFMKQDQTNKVNAGELNPAEATMIDFFEGTTKEAEDVMRYFKDRALRLSKQTQNPKRTSDEITRNHINVIDEILGDADPSGQLLELHRAARKNYSETVGEATDMGYVPDVIAGRKNKAGIVRKNRQTLLKEEEGNYKYKNINSERPETPFYNIGNLGEKLLTAKSVGEADEILVDIASEKNRLFSFLGATQRTSVDGRTTYAFDLREPRQEKIYQMAQGLLNTIVSHKLAHKVVDEAGKVNSVVKSVNGGKLDNLDNINVESYSFPSAMNMIKMEQKLTMPVIQKDGTVKQVKFFDATEIKAYSVDIVEHMRVSKKTREEYTRLREDMLNTKGALHIEAKGKLDEQVKAIDDLATITNFVKQPKKFYAEHFENATPESVNEFVADLVSAGKYMDPPVTESTIRKSLKYMYLRGVLEIGGEKKSIDMLSSDPSGVVARSEITDVSQFVNLVVTGKNKEVMRAVMGQDSTHVKFLEDVANWITYAGGNTRGFAPRGDTSGISIDSIFSRVFNIARGMVSPLYVGTELATRLLLEKNQSLLTVALRDKNAAKILAQMVKDPEGITDRDIKMLGQRIKVYVTMEVIQDKNKNIPTLNEFMGLDDQEKVQADAGLTNFDDIRLNKTELQGVN